MSGACQGPQPRTFIYDGLGRLASAQNPENALATYTYDPNSNLVSVMQGGVTRCFGTLSGGVCTGNYDPLNRVLSKTYADYSGSDLAATSTPSVTYNYDQAGIPNSIGHLTKVTSGASTMNYLGFDSTGRVTSSSQATGSLTGASFSYTYDLAGSLETFTYPSGRVVTTCHDSAGRVSSVNGQATSTATAAPYAPNIHYTPHGAVDQIKFNNGLFEQSTFNPRLQLTNLDLGTTLGATDRWGVINSFGGADNNGNVLRQTITAPNLSVTQYFQYDPLNRLVLATENPANPSSPACPDASSQWCELFTYDIYGNRTMSQSTNVGLVTPQSFNAATNQIADSGWGYDHSANLNQDQAGLLI